MVQLLPRDRFIIQTPEALQTVIERLEVHMEPPKFIRSTFDLNHAPFEGTISASGFKMNRISLGRPNAVEPRIEGRFETPPGGTVVHITLKLHPAVLIFVSCWMLVWYGFTLLLWSTGEMDSHLALSFWWLPPFIIVGFWIGFWIAVERARNDLLRIILRRRPQSRQGRYWLLFILQATVSVLSTVFAFWFIATHFFPLLPDLEIPEAVRER